MDVTYSPLTCKLQPSKINFYGKTPTQIMQKIIVKAVASTVRHFRKIRGMSQETLADKANLDRTYISGIERGVRNITLDSLEQIICGLDIDFSLFFIKLIEEINNNKNF